MTETGPQRNRRGMPPTDRREILTAILYVLWTRCPWRALPHDFPNWKTVYTVFWRWRQSGVWQKIHDSLVVRVRMAAGKEPSPTAAVVDSQSVRTTEVGGEERGFDAAKKVTGRKRHLVVDTLGLVLGVAVHDASEQDQDGAWRVLEKLQKRFAKLHVIFGDSAYGRDGLVDKVKRTFGWVLQTVRRPVGVKDFVVLPKRWIVERTFAWIWRRRRHGKDYERNPSTREAMILISMIDLRAKRGQNYFPLADLASHGCLEL